MKGNNIVVTIGAMGLLAFGVLIGFAGLDQLSANNAQPVQTQAIATEQTVVLSELKTEILTDPLALGYAGQSPFQTAVLLNTVGLSGETIDVNILDTQTLQEAVVGSEYLLLSAGEQRLWAVIIGANQNGGAEIRNSNTRAQILEIWNVGTTTRSNLGTLQTRSGSRAEALWGDGTFITGNDVEEALLLP